MKNVRTLILVPILSIVLCGCGNNYKTFNDRNTRWIEEDGYFTVERIISNTEAIIYANDTMVKYYTTIDSRWGGLTPLYNADGTLQIHK